MRIPIRSKLMFFISLLIVVLFSFAAALFIKEKKVEMANDIYTNMLAFSKLTSDKVVENYDLYLAQGGFVYFNREIRAFFEENKDVSFIKVASYSGNLLYDSISDTEKAYDGSLRAITDKALLSQIKSENISLKLLDSGNIYFLKEDANGNEIFVDENEKKIEKFEDGALIDYLVIPANEKYSVIYGIDYSNLNERVSMMQRRILYLAMFGIMLGFIMSFVMSLQITRPVRKLADCASELAKGNFKTRVDIKTSDEIGFLGETFNKMAIDLEASVEAKLYKERVTRELEIAAQIQDQLIPDENQIPKIDGLDIAATIIPAEEIGGDVYDFIKNSDGKLLLYLGDVTGHGVPAGLVSSIASALFYGFSDLHDLKEIIIDVNRVLKVKTMPNMFMTICFLGWDPKEKKLFYVNAGHPQFIHYKVKEGKAILAPTSGIALGMVKDISPLIKVEEINFESGDYIIIYSDGIPESWKNEKEYYGIKRLMASVERNRGVASASKMKDAILADLKAYVGGYKQMDDITLIVLKKD